MNAYAASPNQVALARAIASSSVLNGVIGATGPKISSASRDPVAGTPATTVGG